jgi:caa(3)-type oxidase subunit IV
LGAFNQPIALTIAFSKAILVLYFFMELRTSEKLVWVWIGAAFLWVLLLLCGIFMDVLQRTTILPPLL